MRPAGPATSARWVAVAINVRPSTTDVGRQQQALDHAPLLQVRVDDLVDIVLVDIGVPDGLGVHHGDRAAGATVEAAGLVDAHAARPGQPQRLDARLAMIERLLRLVLRAAGFAVAALVEAEEDVVLVVAHVAFRRAACRRCGPHATDASALRGVRNCRDVGARVALRFSRGRQSGATATTSPDTATTSR